MRYLLKMGEICDYSGELAWCDGCVSVPMVILSLKVKEPGLRIYVDFASRNHPTHDRKDYYEHDGEAQADQPVMRRQLPSDSEWLVKQYVEPIYVAERCWPYRGRDVSVFLEWKAKELRDLDGDAYCHVQARWIEHDGENFHSWRCAGLLKGKAVETFLLPKNAGKTASSPDG